MARRVSRRSTELRKIDVSEFVRRLRTNTEPPERRFTFFLGAGCSVSSGVPAAGALVKEDWLPRLCQLHDPAMTIDDCAAKVLSRWNPKAPAASYGEVIEKLFLTSGERQREIERLCTGRSPGFGYAVLSGLMTLPDGLFSVVLTTNFDDLVEDALAIFRRTRPLVIQHESLAPFIRPTRTRPMVVKLHGDHRLAPRNTAEETLELNEIVAQRVNTVLHDRGIVFVGYGGNDESITRMFESLPEEALPFGIYWVSEHEPRGIFRPWLEDRQAVWVEHRDFDELMLLVLNEFTITQIPHPDATAYDRVFADYTNAYKELSVRVRARTDPASETAKRAVEATDKTFPDWLAYLFTADRLEKSDPDRAEDIYRQVIGANPKNANCLNNYAVFLQNVRKNTDQAEEYYKRAIDADPKYAIALGNYALFLQNVRSNGDRAEEHYKRAVDADPKHAIALGSYAAFLQTVRKDNDHAEEFYKRAIDADPKHAGNLGNYAAFLQTVRKDADRAEEFFKRAIDADPKHVGNLGNYALFLQNVRNDTDRAEEHYRRAIDADPKNASNLGNYALFLQNVRNDADQAEGYYKRAIDADPKHAGNLGNYALFLKDVRKDADRAEEHYRRAIDADPKNASNLGNYALFLNGVRKSAGRAEEFYKRSIGADPKNANGPANYAQLLFVGGRREEGLIFLNRAIELLDTAETPSLGVEVWFYAYAHGPEVDRPAAIKKLKACLLAGSRSPEWDLKGNVDRAVQDGHPEGQWLPKLAAVISEGASLDSIDGWEQWQQA